MTRCLTLTLFLLFTAHLPLKGASDPRIQVLPNGIHTYVWERAESDEDIELRLAIPVGLVHEREGEAGAVRTLAKGMMQKVCFSDLAGIECYECWNSIGRLDTTYFSVSIPPYHLERLPKIIELFAAWAWKWDPTFENSVTLDHDIFSCGEETELAMYAGRECSEPVTTLPSEKTLSEFYNKTYRSLPLAVVAVGNFDSKWVEELIAGAFSSTPFGDLGPLSSPTPLEKWPHQVTIITKRYAPYPTFATSEIYLPRSSTEKLTPREMMANFFLFDILNSRFTSAFENDLNEISGDPIYLTKSCTFQCIHLDCPSDKVVPACILLESEVKKIALEGATREELEKTRTKIYSRMFEGEETFSFDQTLLADSCMDHFRGICSPLNDDFTEGLQTATATMTVDDIQMLAKSLKPLSKGRISLTLPEMDYNEELKVQLKELFKQ